MPFAKVEVADVEVILRAVVWIPPAKVEVPVELETNMPYSVVVPVI